MVLPALAGRLASVDGSDDLLVKQDGMQRSFAIRSSPLRDRVGRTHGEVVLLSETTERRRIGELERSRELIIEAEERLRLEIAELLHGGVQTRLLLAGFHLADSRELVSHDPAGAVAALEALGVELDAIREHEVRRVSHRLHPSVIVIGLVPALESLAASQARNLTIDVRADEGVLLLDAPVQNRLPAELRLAVYRVVEEALGNVQRHAQATRVSIELSLAGDAELSVTIVDNGRGLPAGPVSAGLGLNAIAARVSQLGGTWHLDAAPRGGAQLVVRVPIAQAAAVSRLVPSGRALDDLEHRLG